MLGALIPFWTQQHPELRLGQIVENARALSGTGASVFYLDDDDFLRGLHRIEDMYNHEPLEGET